MNNQDILKELEAKNREIYINKLNLDLDNNEEISLITIDNILNLFEIETVNKILEIESSNLNKENISNTIMKFKEILKEKIHTKLKDKTIKLKELTNDIDNINYQEKINELTQKITENIKNIYNDNIDNLISEIKSENEFNNNRIEEYIRNINYNKFINKINSSLQNMDIILYNNYLESENKFHNLNEKTLK